MESKTNGANGIFVKRMNPSLQRGALAQS